MSEKHPTNIRTQEIQRLLASVPVIASAHELDLLVFLYRHPYTLLTNEQLANFVGYDMKQIAKAIDAFIEANLLERTQNPAHSARIYRLILDGPNKGGLKALLELASTREGRQSILPAIKSQSSNPPRDRAASRRRLFAIA